MKPFNEDRELGRYKIQGTLIEIDDKWFVIDEIDETDVYFEEVDISMGIESLTYKEKYGSMSITAFITKCKDMAFKG